MSKKKPTAGERMIASAKQALAFARGEPDHGCIVHVPADQGKQAEYIEGYRQGKEDALKWLPPETLPQQNGTETILWLTTDKGFEDVAAHSYLKDEVWYWYDTDEPIKRQDLILGWLPWPKPPVK